MDGIRKPNGRVANLAHGERASPADAAKPSPHGDVFERGPSVVPPQIDDFEDRDEDAIAARLLKEMTAHHPAAKPEQRRLVEQALMTMISDKRSEFNSRIQQAVKDKEDQVKANKEKLEDAVPRMSGLISSSKTFESVKENISKNLVIDTALELFQTLDTNWSDKDLAERYNFLSADPAKIEQLASSPLVLLGQDHTDLKGLLDNLALTVAILRQNPEAKVLLEAQTSGSTRNLFENFLTLALVVKHMQREGIAYDASNEDKMRYLTVLYRTAAEALFSSIKLKNPNLEKSLGTDHPLLRLCDGWNLPRPGSVTDRNQHLGKLLEFHKGKKLIVHAGARHLPAYNQAFESALSASLQSGEKKSIEQLKSQMPSGSIELVPNTVNPTYRH